MFGKDRARSEPSKADVEEHLGLILDRGFARLLHSEVKDAHLRINRLLDYDVTGKTLPSNCSTDTRFVCGGKTASKSYKKQNTDKLRRMCIIHIGRTSSISHPLHKTGAMFSFASIPGKHISNVGRRSVSSQAPETSYQLNGGRQPFCGVDRTPRKATTFRSSSLTGLTGNISTHREQYVRGGCTRGYLLLVRKHSK